MKSEKGKYERRTFLQTAGVLTAGSIMLPQWACTDASSNASKESVAEEPAPIIQPSLDKFGIQLYTLREDMPKDPKGVLKQLASFGYQQIEGFEGKQGMFWDMPHTDFKTYLDDLGLEMVSSHCNIFENFETKAAQAAEIGMAYLICPWVGPQKSVEDWKKVTEKFNECGKICKDNGIRFAYHNHEYTFKAFSGMIPHDFLMENTDPELVDHEMDIYWVVTGGADPIDYLTKYPNRFRLCHVKDRLKTAAPDEREASCDLGTGSIDFPKILKVAADNGMKYFILEQERYDNSTPVKSAEVGAEYLKKLVFV
ncbi:MAG: sugar phosphate isomerase [Saprospiraceae bacterium]|nr:MAG: sugar phosphate isomerase [Saprospiraceae bacterium]